MAIRNIHADVAGRSAEVLNALGIDLRSLRRHVLCPFPNHEDRNPSFRFDEKAARFYCTCTPKGGSVVDLVIGMGHAGSFVEAARWIRRELLITHHPVRQKVPAPPNRPPEDNNTNQVSFADQLAHYIAGCVPVPLTHPYLMKKKIPPLAALFEPNLEFIVLPIHDQNFDLVGAEQIGRDGRKMCIEGSRKNGNGLMLGDASRSPVLGVAEGWATGVSIHIALNGLPVLITFGAANLSAAQNFRRPDQHVWFFADNDKVGIDAAHEASRNCNPHGYVLIPRLADFNDDFASGLEKSSFDRIRQAIQTLGDKK